MSKIQIHRNSSNKITENFQEFEFYTKADKSYIPSQYSQSHPLEKSLINAVQIVRDHFGVQVYITSTYRPKIWNKKIGGAESSCHIDFTALDFNFGGKYAEDEESYLSKYNREIKNKGNLFKKLLGIGIKGFGLYDNFTHIDTCKNNGHSLRKNPVPFKGKHGFFDNRVTTRDDWNYINGIFNAYTNTSQDGYNDTSNKTIVIVSIIGLIIIVTSIYFIYKYV